MKEIFNNFLEKLKLALTFDNIDMAKNEFMGKSGVLTNKFKLLGKLSADEKKKVGAELNIYKTKAEEAIAKQIEFVKNLILEQKLKDEKVDITLPVDNSYGSLHILTKEIRRIKREYQARGYLVLDGPEIETEFYNFDALNIPKYHPARQTQDTFYLSGLDEDKLLRTQTSSVQIHALEEIGVPLRMISIGKTYRSDQLDATHSPMFHQIEGLVVDREPLNIGHLRKTLKEFISFVFALDNIEIRFRPSFFPFTEPSMEFDCKYKDKWLEIGGSGMVHPNVFKNTGIPEEVYGFAFGVGLERLIMLKYSISDIRLLFENDNRWLKHYSSTRN